ncbi:Uncharacterised protein [Legionella lansingensis]|uniref:Transmembrane protein n=1 Tax=Legionella lansingensis TaxID=45067 RepID=A0A0W0VRD8_9GAMM|nr:DUF4381 domain-containing protein [Legionella lansingensis]KTD22740.1 hypothetical protein Llan_1091 [Legionella lansingensis]SNV56754.1 Uncharacterised protein [Legionella lansingensis]
MADSQLLKQLHDIHLPHVVGWWPLAPGWYVLLVVVVFVAAMLTYLGYRRHANLRPKKEALRLLASYEKEYMQEKNSQLSSIKISELLRRVALVYFPRSQVAGVQGRRWLDFLNATAKGVNFDEVSDLLLELPYQSASRVDLKPLFDLARAWIKQRGIPCSN